MIIKSIHHLSYFSDEKQYIPKMCMVPSVSSEIRQFLRFWFLQLSGEVGIVIIPIYTEEIEAVCGRNWLNVLLNNHKNYLSQTPLQLGCVSWPIDYGRSNRAHLQASQMIFYVFSPCFLSLLVDWINEEESVKDSNETFEVRRASMWQETGSLHHADLHCTTMWVRSEHWLYEVVRCKKLFALAALPSLTYTKGLAEGHEWHLDYTILL